MQLARPLVLLVLVSLVVQAGCGRPAPEFGEVSGQVTINGKPAADVYLQFFPDPESGNEIAANSYGETDDQGQYTLRYVFDGREGKGAAVGPHRVVVEDMRLSGIPQGGKIPPLRFDPRYSNIGMTPLTYEVTPGSQTINIEVKK